MKRLLLVFLFCLLPLVAELTDPGAGLTTRASRKSVRVATWEAQWAALSVEGKQNQARAAVEDRYDLACLWDVAKDKTGNPALTAAEAREWLEDRLDERTVAQSFEFLDNACPSRTFVPHPNIEEQGGPVHRVLIIRGTAVARATRNLLPIFQRIGNVPPLNWEEMGKTGDGGSCTIGGLTGPCHASAHPFHEVHLHLIEAIVRAEGRLSNFALVPLEHCTIQQDVEVCVPWYQEPGLAWTPE